MTTINSNYTLTPSYGTNIKIGENANLSGNNTDSIAIGFGSGGVVPVSL